MVRVLEGFEAGGKSWRDGEHFVLSRSGREEPPDKKDLHRLIADHDVLPGVLMNG
jgi:hypothetical protein